MLKKFLFILFVVALISGAGYYIWQDLNIFEKKSGSGENIPAENNNITDLSCSIDGGSDAESDCLKKEDEANIEISDLDNAGVDYSFVKLDNENFIIDIPLPNLDRAVVFGDDFSEEQKTKLMSQIDSAVEALKKDNYYFNGWINLGLFRKAVGDYEGTKEAWEYASAIMPQDALSFSNLGVLYGYYLKDNKKAEENYLKAIENEPLNGYYYNQLYEFYRDVLEDKTKIRQILEKAVKNKTGDYQDFQKILDDL